MKKTDLYDVNMTPSKQNISTFISNATLTMSSCELTNLPVDDIKNYIRKNTLDKLVFSNNKLDNIYPFESVLHIFQSLKEINLSNNSITKFPLFILSLPNLVALNVSKNKISNFPSEQFTNENIHDLKCSLVYFDISFNQLTSMPDIIGLYTNISTVILANNRISHINNISNMKLEKLDTLNLGNNKIERLPCKLYKNIPNVKVLIFENNNLKDIPTDTCLLFNLNVINFYGNAIKKIRSEYLLNAQGLLTYLKKLHSYDNEDYAYEESKTYKTDNSVPNTNSSNKMGNVGYQNNFNQAFCNNNNSITSSNQLSVQEQINKINEEIAVVEESLQQPNIQMFKKNDLRKQLHALMRQRANLLK